MQAERANMLTSVSLEVGGFETYHPDLITAHQETEAFLNALLAKQEPRWLTLTGPSGVGKTLLARALRKQMRALGAECKLVTWPLLVARCADERDWSYMAGLSMSRTLIIDDLGVESKGLANASKDSLAMLLYARAHKWTMLTSNLYLDGLAAYYDARISDRMLRGGSRFVKIGEDCQSWSAMNYSK